MKKSSNALDKCKKYQELVPEPLRSVVGVLVGILLVISVLVEIANTLAEPPFSSLWKKLPALRQRIDAEIKHTFRDPKPRPLFNHLAFVGVIAMHYSGALLYAAFGALILGLAVAYSVLGYHGVNIPGVVVATLVCSLFVKFYVAQSGQAEEDYRNYRLKALGQ